jgi:hypothetical protein
MHIIKEKNMDLRAAFCIFVRTLPIDFALLGRKRKYIKSKTTAKLKANKPRSPRSETNSYHLPPFRPPFFLVTDYLFKESKTSSVLSVVPGLPIHVLQRVKEEEKQ